MLALSSEDLKKSLEDVSEPFKDLLVRNNRNLLKDVIDNINKSVNDPNLLCPAPELIFNAFKRIKNLNVVIIGQDPYPNRRNACGVAFSVPRRQPVPDSLYNIYKCLLHHKLIKNIPDHGCLDKWIDQGVLLLNSSLTTVIGKPNSHLFWHKYTDKIISDISDKYDHVVFMLWGKFAEQKSNLINAKKHHVLIWGHPSNTNFVNKDDNNLKNFKYCDHFVQCNKFLESLNQNSIDWNPNDIHSIDMPGESGESVGVISATNLERTYEYDGDSEDNDLTDLNDDHTDKSSEDLLPIAINTETDNEKTIWLASDGACKNNGKVNSVASYGYIIVFPDNQTVESNGLVPNIHINGKKYKTSNQRGELTGIIKALEHLISDNISNMVINMVIDSKYVIGNFPDYVIKHNIVNTMFKAVENLDLINIMHNLLDVLNKNNCELNSFHIHSHCYPPDDIKSIEYLKWWMNYYVDDLATKKLIN